MIALVTGATGFVGRHLVERLQAEGYRVRCLVRSVSRPHWLRSADVEIVRADCTRSETLADAVRGADLVFHAASVTWAPRRAAYFQTNAVGTHNLLQACAAHAPSLKRFVFVSSQAAAGPSPADRGLNESDVARPISAYGESKLLAERHVSAFRDRFPCVIARPSAVYGPRDNNFLPYLRLAKRGLLLEFGAGDRVVSLCHVQDLVAGLLAAVDGQGPSGSVYFLADPQPYGWRDVERTVCRALGVDARRLVMPKWSVQALAAVGQVYGAIANRPVQLNAVRVAELLAKTWVCDVTKAQQELGFESRTEMAEGLPQLIRWYQQQHWL